MHLTMDEAIRRALANGQEMRLARAGVDQANAAVRQAWASGLPEVRFNATYTRTFASIFQSGTQVPRDTSAFADSVFSVLAPMFGGIQTFGAENSYTAAITVGQLLFQGDKVGAGIRGARAYERAARAQLDETREDLVFRVKQAYLNALFADRLLAIAVEGKALTDSQLARVQLNHNVGSAADYDLLRAQVEAANQEPQVIAARNARDLAQLELLRLVNLPPDQPLGLDAGALEVSDSLPLVDADRVSMSEANRALIDAAEQTVAFRREAVKVYAGDLWPSLRFDMTYGGQAFPLSTFPGYSDFRRDWNARLTLSFPIFDGFRARAQVANARAEMERAQAQLEQTREGVAIEIRQARAEVQRARALLAARRQTVEQASRAHHLATVRFANGIATSLEVSDARLAMQQAEVNEAQAMRDYLLGVASLERATGRTVTPVRAGAQAFVGGRQ